MDKAIHILFVDDEQHILNSLRRAFHGIEQYTCHFANSPKAALEVLAEHSVTVLVSDHKMPQMPGAEFLARVKEKRPDTVRMLLTGQADLETVQRAVNCGEIFRFFTKPWKDDELRQAVHEAVLFQRLTVENRELLALTTKQNEQLADTNAQLESQVQHRTEQLSSALYTARTLNEQLAQSLYDGTKAMFHMIRLARPELGSHSRRVADFCLECAPALGITGEDLFNLEIAALLHDGGKLGLPPVVVETHPSDYTHQQIELYKTHPTIGSEFLKGVRRFESICKFVAAHHERLDGSGFPLGVGGAHVPVEAYLIGMLDEYDHLMSRPLHSVAFNLQYSRQVFAEYADRKFPGRVVQVVLDFIARVSDVADSSDTSEVSLSALAPGLVLARDVYTMSGHLLLASGAALTSQAIYRIRAIAQLDALAGEIVVQKKRTEESISATA